MIGKILADLVSLLLAKLVAWLRLESQKDTTRQATEKLKAAQSPEDTASSHDDLRKGF